MKQEKNTKTIKYKGRNIKMSDDTWFNLKKRRKESGYSWNQFLIKLMK